MDIQFFNNGDASPQPREDVKIESVTITPYRDRRRLRVNVKVTAFRERPNLNLSIHDEDDNIVSELNIIETMHYDMEFTMHLRTADDPAGSYSLTTELFYDTRTPPQDEVVTGFTIAAESAGDES